MCNTYLYVIYRKQNTGNIIHESNASPCFSCLLHLPCLFTFRTHYMPTGLRSACTENTGSLNNAAQAESRSACPRHTPPLSCSTTHHWVSHLSVHYTALLILVVQTPAQPKLRNNLSNLHPPSHSSMRSQQSHIRHKNVHGEYPLQRLATPRHIQWINVLRTSSTFALP